MKLSNLGVLAPFWALAACQSAPPQSSPAAPTALVLKQEGSNPAESLFNTRIRSQADTIAGTFATRSEDPGSAPVIDRLESSWTRNLQAGDELRLGDTVSDAGTWGNPVRFAGIQLSSQRALRSDVVANSRLALAGIAGLPTVADILLAANRPGTPGGISSNGNVRVSGLNAISLQARDAAGRSIGINQTLIARTQLAEPGCERFSFGAGRVRENYALEDDSYGAWFGNSRMVCGSQSGLTLEGQSEYLEGFGGTFALDVARDVGIGTAAVGFGWSEMTRQSGWLARFAFDHSNPWFDFNLRAHTNSPEFRRVAMLSMAEVASQQAMASLGLKLGEQNNLALIYATEVFASLENPTELWALSQRTRFGTSNSLAITARHSQTGDPLSLHVSFTRAFGHQSRPATSDLADYLSVRTPRLER